MKSFSSSLHKARTAAARAPQVGLARAISKLGYCSRSRAAELIRAGRVQLNGAVRREPETPVRLDRDKITVDAQHIRAAQKEYWMLNKPRGSLTTAADEQGRQTVYDLLPVDRAWLAPVGRLDKASEGLLLLTNDSAWAARVTAPETHLDKTYHVQIAALAGQPLLESLRRGVRDGAEALRVKRVSILRGGEKNSWLEIVLDEGKNRHIRRMLDALGVDILRLIRVAIGGLRLGDLGKGALRQLTAAEKSNLDAEMARKFT